ncbi:MAG: sensor histidine kinase, partial [Actinobacteria bacterium]|nr:sensor histidine kinase [Actinomycetota bacterium]
RRTLAAGILVFRWGALAWLAAQIVVGGTPLVRPWLVATSVIAVVAWNVRVTLARGRLSDTDRWIDLAVAAGLVIVSAYVVPRGFVLAGLPFFATMYPAAAALSWGADRGAGAGLAAGLVLSAALAASRPLNGLPLNELAASEVQNLANGTVYLLLAGGASGVISRLLDRSAEQLRAAAEDVMRERERAARYAERERIARQIHDSVLQSLALVHKRGRELARAGPVPAEAVAELARTAGEQERALRELIVRVPEAGPAGQASLRDALEEVARASTAVPVEVSAVGPLWLPAQHVAEIAAAAAQALANVEVHSRATRAVVFADASDGWVHVSVRDDGVGFVLDPERLRADGRAGILKSVIGRIEDLGGEARIVTAPGRGTEVEIRVPERAA